MRAAIDEMLLIHPFDDFEADDDGGVAMIGFNFRHREMRLY